MTVTAKTIPIGTARSRGRPRKTALALMLDQSFSDFNDELATFPLNLNHNTNTNTCEVYSELPIMMMKLQIRHRDGINHISTINSSKNAAPRPVTFNFDSTNKNIFQNVDTLFDPITDDDLVT